jgi:hypothetical protein
VAKAVYGTVLAHDAVDAAATGKLRQALVAERRKTLPERAMGRSAKETVSEQQQ